MIKSMFEKLRKFNRIVLYLSLSDVFTWGPYTLISMLTGLYLSTKLGQDVVEFVGVGTAIYFFTRSIFPIPIGILTDKYRKDKDEIMTLFSGVILMGFPFILYPHITTEYQYYFLQFLFGLGVSLNVTSWRKLFALNIDLGREGRQYSIYEIIMSFSTACISIVGGYIANLGPIYFDLVMSLAGGIIMLGGIWSILIYLYEKRRSNKK